MSEPAEPTLDGEMPRATRRRGARVRSIGRAVLLNPFSVCFGPIFLKEMRVAGRNAGVYWMRGSFVAILLLLLSLAFLFTELETASRSPSNARRLQQYQDLAPLLANFVVWTQFILLLFIAPVLTSPAISRERFARTMPALMTTPMSSAQIVMGKLCSGISQLLILVLIPVPMLLAIRVLGGLDPTFILGATCVTISSAIMAASLGILCSCWNKRSSSATITAIGLVVAVLVAPLLVALVIAFRSPRPPDWIIYSSSPVALGVLSANMSGDATLTIGLPWWMKNTLINLGVAGGAALIATLTLRRTMRLEVAGRVGVRAAVDAPDDADPAGAPRRRGPKHRWWHRHRRGGHSRVVADHPMIWREFRRGRAKPVIAIVAGIAAIIGMIWAYVEWGVDAEGIHAVVSVVGVLLLGLQATVCTTGGIANERESKTWDALMTTPLAGSSILFAKTVGGMRQLSLVAFLMLFDFVVGVVFGDLSPFVGIHVGMIALGAVVFLGGTGTLFSLLMRKATGASVLNMLTAACLWAGLPLLVAFIAGVSGIDPEDWAGPILWINPVFMTAMSLEGGLDSGGYDLPGANGLSAAAFTAALFIPMMVGVAAGLGALGLAILLFPKRCGRSS